MVSDQTLILVDLPIQFGYIGTFIFRNTLIQEGAVLCFLESNHVLMILMKYIPNKHTAMMFS